MLAKLDAGIKKDDGDTVLPVKDSIEGQDESNTEQIIGEIEKCCFEWRAGSVVPRWVILAEKKSPDGDSIVLLYHVITSDGLCKLTVVLSNYLFQPISSEHIRYRSRPNMRNGQWRRRRVPKLPLNRASSNLSSMGMGLKSPLSSRLSVLKRCHRVSCRALYHRYSSAHVSQPLLLRQQLLRHFMPLSQSHCLIILE